MNKATDPRDKNKTKQDYGTDPKFWEILNKRFNFVWDLACTEENCLIQSAGFTYPEYDALKEDWFEFGGWLYLNPPFKDIKPWAEKCYKESLKGAKIVLLTPASVGSVWFNDWVFQKAHIFFLKGRLTFKGETAPYPKDCMISVYDNFHKGIDIFDWRK